MPAMTELISVEVPGAHYDVMVEAGLLSRVGQKVSGLTRSKKVGIITDSHVGPMHLQTLRISLEELGIEAIEATIPAGEDHKTMEHLMPVFDRFLGAKIDRNTPLIALGGGMIGDMTGFVAATILRGVPFMQVPTSLLAMVDASVGGKTGINHAVGKNLIGAFHQPIAVFIDPELLKTLPPSELRSGLAECIKHDIIRDAQGFARLEQSIHRALELDIEYLAGLVAHNIALKARIVAADPFERGERAHLNLGHTFGHAIEIVSKYSYSHGECVALGMVAAAYTAQQLGLLNEPSRHRIINTISKAGLPTAGLKLDVKDLIDAMAFDKKIKAGKLRFILPDGIGKAVIRDDVPIELVKEALEQLATK
jgi:3-dehydroquinate synthase